MNSPLLFSDDSLLDENDLETKNEPNPTSSRIPLINRHLSTVRSTSNSPLLFSPVKENDKDLNELKEINTDKFKQIETTREKINKTTTKEKSKLYSLFLKPSERKRQASDNIENESPLPKHLVDRLTSPSFVKNYDKKALEVFDRNVENIDLSNPIRNKNLRSKMHGYECVCCKDYYDKLDLSPESRKKRVNQVSRHRAFQGHEMPPTPPGYWDVKFPSIEERRNYDAVLSKSTSEDVKKSKAARRMF